VFCLSLPRPSQTTGSFSYISPSLAFLYGRELNLYFTFFGLNQQPDLYFTFTGLFIRPGAEFIFHLPRPSAGSRIYILPSPASMYMAGREPNLYFTFPGLRPGAGSRESGALVLARQAQVVQVVGPSGSVAGMRVSTPTLTAFSYFSEFFSYFS
jgi:hypothetical protein